MRTKKHRESPDRQAKHSSQEGGGPSFSTTRVILRGKYAEEVPFAERAYLEVLGEDGKNRIIELGDLGGSEATIGRGPHCDIRLAVDSVSRKHARIALRNEEYHVEDMNSTNGVYVNGVRVVKCVLRDNDQIEMGGVKIIFKEEKTLKDR
jgi:pSer/pThr/pTyr-binding forkhead associated (FHA) protein